MPESDDRTALRPHVSPNERCPTLLDLLNAPDADVQDRATARLAFDTLPVDPSLVPRLEAALVHRSPRVLALVLTSLGRTLFENPDAAIVDPGRVSALALHPDSRVAYAATTLLAVRGAYERPDAPSASLVDRVAGLPYPLVVEELRAALTASRRHIADALERPFNAEVSSRPGSAPEAPAGQKQDLALWINATLGELGLALVCPKTGRPALVFGHRRRPGADEGYFIFENADCQGRKSRDAVRKSLPWLRLFVGRVPRASTPGPKRMPAGPNP